MCLQIGQTSEKAVIILIQTKLLVKRPSLFNGCLTLKGPLTHLIVDLFSANISFIYFSFFLSSVLRSVWWPLTLNNVKE